MKKNHNIIELEVFIKLETSAGNPNRGAILVSNEKTEEAWIPKSLVEWDGDIPGNNEISIPKNVAYDKGLI